MRLSRALTAATLGLAALTLAPAASAQLGFAVRASTLGFGGDVSYALSPRLNVRLGGSYLPYSQSDRVEQDGVTVQYEADGRAGSGQGLVDWFPAGNLFRVTGGLMLNLIEANARIFSVEPYTINEGQASEKTFSPERVGTMTGTAGYHNKVAPYLGLGLGNATRGGLGFELEVGAMYAGKPKIDMTGTGLIAPTADQDQDLQNGLESFRVFPMLSLGISFGARK